MRLRSWPQAHWHDDPASGRKSWSWVSATCPLCGAADAPVEREVVAWGLARKPKFALCGCTRCGLRWLNPRPDLASLAMFPPVSQAPARGWRGRLQAILRWARRSPIVTNDPWAQLTATGPTLWVRPACESSTKLTFASEAGLRTDWPFHVTDRPEQLPASSILSRQDRGQNCGQNHQTECETGIGWSWIVLDRVLDQWPDPAAWLVQLRRRLRPGGCILGRLDPWDATQADWGVPQRLTFWTPGTLMRLGLSVGLTCHRVVRCRETGGWEVRWQRTPTT